MIRLDTAKVLKELYAGADAALDMIAGEEYKSTLASEFSHAHPVSKGWGDSVAAYVDKELGHNVGTPLRRIDMKIDDGAPMFIQHRAEVLDIGNGEVWTNPGGQVYDTNMDQLSTSNATSHRELPQWEHEGQHVVDNAERIMESKAGELMDMTSMFIWGWLGEALKDCISGA